MTTSDRRALVQAMADVVGEDNVRDGPSDRNVDGLRPTIAVLPENILELSQVMAGASGADLTVAPWGGGTRIEVGNPIDRLDVVADLSRLDGIVQHNPADLTVTVEAGATIDAVQQTLAKHAQFLALDPPIPSRATIGGTLATGASGPLKWQFGHPRDLVIGMKMVQADGKVVKSGGQVVKNVSGYDMARLHIGGLGTLGIIAEVSFKLTPLPHGEATLVAAFGSEGEALDAGQKIFHSGTVPLALTYLNDGGYRRAGPVNEHSLAVRLGGRPRTLERQLRDCRSICEQNGATAVRSLDRDEAGLFWSQMADFGWVDGAPSAVVCRIYLAPDRLGDLGAVLLRDDVSDRIGLGSVCHVGYGTALLHWYADDLAVDEAETIVVGAREAVHALGGRVVVERCPLEVKRRFDVWDEVGEPLEIMRRMKKEYDPKGTLNPGRYVGRI